MFTHGTASDSCFYMWDSFRQLCSHMWQLETAVLRTKVNPPLNPKLQSCPMCSHSSPKLFQHKNSCLISKDSCLKLCHGWGQLSNAVPYVDTDIWCVKIAVLHCPIHEKPPSDAVPYVKTMVWSHPICEHSWAKQSHMGTQLSKAVPYVTIAVQS